MVDAGLGLGAAVSATTEAWENGKVLEMHGDDGGIDDVLRHGRRAEVAQPLKSVTESSRTQGQIPNTPLINKPNQDWWCLPISPAPRLGWG